MMESDETVLYCTLEIVRLGTSEGVTRCERWVRFDASGVPIWDHAYGVIDGWLYQRGVDNYTAVYRPLLDYNGHWLTHFITRDGETVRLVRLIPPARVAAAV